MFLRLIVAFVFSTMFYTTAYGQFKSEVDSVNLEKLSESKSPNMIFEFLGGAGAHILSFYSFQGERYIKERNIDNIWAPIGSGIVTSVIVTIIGEQTSKKNANQWFTLLCTAVGTGVGWGLANAVESEFGQGSKPLLQYVAFSLPTIVAAIFGTNFYILNPPE